MSIDIGIVDIEIGWGRRDKTIMVSISTAVIIDDAISLRGSHHKTLVGELR